MKSLVVFLNELSFISEHITEAPDLLPHVLSALSAVRETRKIRGDLVVAGQMPLAGVLLGDGTCSLAQVLRGDDHREEWRLLQSLDQSSPWDAYPEARRPGILEEVKHQGRRAVGMLWAKKNESAIVSFALPPNWADSHIDAQFDEMREGDAISSSAVRIPNLSRVEHVTAHRMLIDNYGRVMSASSLVYEGDGFVIRMFFNDHNPPHFHVMTRRESPETVARYAIETLDRLSGNLSGAVRDNVEKWAARRRTELMGNWERCRRGEHPFALDE